MCIFSYLYKLAHDLNIAELISTMWIIWYNLFKLSESQFLHLHIRKNTDFVRLMKEIKWKTLSLICQLVSSVFRKKNKIFIYKLCLRDRTKYRPSHHRHLIHKSIHACDIETKICLLWDTVTQKPDKIIN
jgi:hypothetical protein